MDLSITHLALDILILASAALMWRRERTRWNHDGAALTRQVAGLASDLGALCIAERRVGDRVAMLESEGRKILHAQNRLEMREPATGNYRQAIALAARGADVGDLMRECGLERNEAELMSRLHRAETAVRQPRVALGAE